MELVIIFAVIFLGGIIFAIFSEEEKIKRELKDLPTTKIYEFKDGELKKIQGTIVIPESPLKAPGSGRACAAFQIHVEERRVSANNDRWVDIAKEERKINFLVKDEDSYAYVFTDMATLVIEQDDNRQVTVLRDPSSHRNVFTEVFGEDSIFKHIGSRKTLRYEEGVLEEGERVTVHGIGIWRNTSEYPELSFLKNDGVDRVLVIDKAINKNIYICDSPVLFNHD